MPKRTPPSQALEERRSAEVEQDDWLAGEDDPWLDRAYVPGDWFATMRMLVAAIVIGAAIWAGVGLFVLWLVI